MNQLPTGQLPAPRVLAIIGLLLLTACASTPTADQHASPPRSAGYAALYDLMLRNAGISNLLLFKSVDPAVKIAIDDFAKLCDTAARQLNQLAQADPSINLQSPWLTPIEQQTRASIESATTSNLLTSSGKPFHTHLLLSQTNAAEYGSHLAQALAKLETHPDRKQYLAGLAEQLNQTHQRLVKLLTPPDSKP